VLGEVDRRSREIKKDHGRAQTLFADDAVDAPHLTLVGEKVLRESGSWIVRSRPRRPGRLDVLPAHHVDAALNPQRRQVLFEASFLELSFVEACAERNTGEDTECAVAFPARNHVEDASKL